MRIANNLERLQELKTLLNDLFQDAQEMRKEMEGDGAELARGDDYKFVVICDSISSVDHFVDCCIGVTREEQAAETVQEEADRLTDCD